MGFSLRNLFNEATAQINPLDGGKSAVTVRRNRENIAAQTLKKEQDDEATMQMLRQKANQRLLEQRKTGTIPVGNVAGYGVRTPQASQRIAFEQQQRNIMGNGSPIIGGQHTFQNQNAITGAVRNIFDSNSEVDKVNRQRQGMPTMYRDQQIAMGNKRPFESLGGQLLGNTARFANTGAYAFRSGVETIRGNLDEQRRLREIYGNPNSGLMGVGTIYNSPEEMMNLGNAEIAKRVGLTTLGTASEIAPFKINPAKGAKLSTKLVANAGVDATTGIGQSAANQYMQTGRIDPKVLVGDTIANTALGVVPTVGGAGVQKLRDPLVQTKLLNEVQKPRLSVPVKNDPQIINIESRITKALMNAGQSTGKLKENYRQKARELMRIRKELIDGKGQGGFIGNNTDPLESLKAEARKYKDNPVGFINSQIKEPSKPSGYSGYEAITPKFIEQHKNRIVNYEKMKKRGVIKSILDSERKLINYEKYLIDKDELYKLHQNANPVEEVTLPKPTTTEKYPGLLDDLMAVRTAREAEQLAAQWGIDLRLGFNSNDSILHSLQKDRGNLLSFINDLRSSKQQDLATPTSPKTVAPKGAPIEKTPTKMPNDPLESLKQEARKYKSAEEFVGNAHKIMDDLKEAGITDSNKARELWRKARVDNYTPKYFDTESSQKILNKEVGSNADTWGKWFREQDHSVLKTMQKDLDSNPAIRDATLSRFYEHYKKIGGENISFDEFLNKDITLYRGGNTRPSNGMVSYTPNKAHAARFGDVHEINIKPKDTYGMLGDFSEGEVFVSGQQLTDLYNQATKEATLPVATTPRTQLSGKALETPSKPLSIEDPEAGIWAMKDKPLSKADEGTFAMPKQIKVKQPNTESAVPVRQVLQEGDYVTAKNVNPNIKATEKRFSVDNDGNLIEDKKGAYRIFHNEDGHVTGFRIGDEYHPASELGDLTDVNDYGSALATQRRNVERAFGKETGDKVQRFLVDDQQARATQMIDRQVNITKQVQQVADDLGISFKTGKRKAKKVSAAIQDYGEGRRSYQSLVDEYGADYANKIVNADKFFRGQYDTLLKEMNDTLEKHGYDPVPPRKDYYTHFQDKSLWASFGLKMQEIRNMASPTMQDAVPDGTRGRINNNLAGMSEFTQPNKRWNPFAQQRKGDAHTADAFQAFERYLSPTLNNIYMTPSITRARVLARVVADEADLVGKDANGIIRQTREWANRLAGKSNRFDRAIIDTKMGNKVIRGMQWAQKKAGQNSIVGNLSTAVMQPIVLSQTLGKFGIKNTVLGLMQEMTRVGDDGAIKKSSFLKRRYANIDRVTAGKMDAARNIANKPLEIVEETTARSTWRAAYNDALSQGKKGNAAIQYADVQAEKTLAGRSIGEKPEIFESKAAGLATMYQLEVNNYWQQVGKEMTKGQVAGTMAAAYGLNLVLQEITGRQVGFNPIDAAIDSYEELQKEEKSGVDKLKTIGQRWAGEVIDNVPFVAPAANFTIGDKSLRKLVGGDSNVGRFGVSSPVSTLVNNPEDLILPFGGAQLRKTWNGIDTFMKGRLDDKNGDTLVNVPQTAENAVKGALFGNNAIKEVNQYYNNIGKKKVDQKPIQNQIVSDAASQSLKGLTKDQQEMLRDTPAERKDATRLEFETTNKADRADEKVKEEFKKSGNGQELPSGKYVANIDGETKTFESRSDYDKSLAKKEKQKRIDDFMASSDKTREIDGRLYLKSDDTESGYTTKSLKEHQFDKDIQGVEIELDKAKAANNLNAWNTAAEKKYAALIKKRDGYDPETEFDKIDKVDKQILDLQQEYEKFASQGYIKKGKSGKGGSRKKLDYSMFASGNQAASVNKSLRQLLESALVG